MGLPHTVSEINGDFGRNLQVFHPEYLMPPAEYWNFVTAVALKKLEFIR